MGEVVLGFAPKDGRIEFLSVDGGFSCAHVDHETQTKYCGDCGVKVKKPKDLSWLDEYQFYTDGEVAPPMYLFYRASSHEDYPPPPVDLRKFVKFVNRFRECGIEGDVYVDWYDYCRGHGG